MRPLTVPAGIPSLNVCSQLYIDREVMDVTAINGTNVTVRRGAGGTMTARSTSSERTAPRPLTSLGGSGALGFGFSGAFSSSAAFPAWDLSGIGYLRSFGSPKVEAGRRLRAAAFSWA